MPTRLKKHLFLLFAYIAAMIFINVIGNFAIVTVCNMIWGPEEEGGSGLRMGILFMRLLMPAVAFFIIYLRKRSDQNDYDAFLEKLGDSKYSRKADFQSLLHSADLWGEVILISVATLIYWLANILNPWLLLNIPLFILFEFLATLRIHRVWLKLSEE